MKNVLLVKRVFLVFIIVGAMSSWAWSNFLAGE